MNKSQEIFQTSMAQGSNNPPDPFLYQEDGKTYALLPAEMLKNIQSSHLYEKMQKDCKAEGIELPKMIMAKDLVAHMVTPQEYLQKVAAGQMRQYEQPPNDGRISSQERSDQNTPDGIPGHRKPEKQVSDMSLQTDTCDTLYVTKNTLTANMIAIVQNSQALQYDQMHAALQTA